MDPSADKSKSREVNRKIAENTLEALRVGSYRGPKKTIPLSKLMDNAKSKSRLYFQDETIVPEWEPRATPTIITVSQCTTLQAAERLTKGELKVAVLNFASARNPGGGFMKGANAQEESLARASGLYPCLQLHSQFYKDNGMEKTRNYTEHIIYSPEVPVFKDDSGQGLEAPYLVNFISSPAPNATAGDRKSVEFLQTILQYRASRILGVAAENQNDVLILGAWGCGVFGNSADSVAEIFKNLIQNEFANCFLQVEFAILDESMAKTFGQVFGTKVQSYPLSRRRVY